MSRFWWCAEIPFIHMKYKPKFEATEAMLAGQVCDDWLRLRPKSKSEQALFNKLEPHRPLHRRHRMLDIYMHEDDLELIWPQREVVVIDWKTKTGGKAPSRHMKAPARFQVQTYAWILDDLFQRIGGYTVARQHRIEYYKRPGCRYVAAEAVYYDPGKVEETLSHIVDYYLGEARVHHPAKWKCDNCRLKQYCRISHLGRGEAAEAEPPREELLVE